MHNTAIRLAEHQASKSSTACRIVCNISMQKTIGYSSDTNAAVAPSRCMHICVKVMKLSPRNGSQGDRLD